MHVLAKSRKTASICPRKTSRTAVSLPALAWQNLIVPSGREAAGASKALPRRISRVFKYFLVSRMYANSRNSTQNRVISRVPVRRYAILWVRARFALSHTISRKCNQQFRSGNTFIWSPLPYPLAKGKRLVKNPSVVIMSTNWSEWESIIS